MVMDSNQIIDALGGSGEVARLCEVSVSAVSQWRKDGIPRARLMYIQLAHPEIFGKTQKSRVRRRNHEAAPAN